MPFIPTFGSLQREINRMFDGARGTGAGYEEETLCDWAPRVDIAERESDYLIQVDLPGLNREDIAVNIDRRGLTISGERLRPEVGEGEHWYRAERQSGTFKRSFTLPDSIDASKVGAEYRDGVLTVTLGKAEEAKPRQIDVKVK